MIAAEGAMAEWKAGYPDKSNRRWCIAVTGQGVKEVQAYAFSYLANVPFDHVNASYEELSGIPPTKLSATVDHATLYGPADDLARCALAHAVIANSLIVVDGSLRKPTSRRPADALLQVIRSAADSSTEIAGIVVDGTDYHIEQILRFTGQKPAARSRLYQEFVSDCGAFGKIRHLPVWVTHRLRSALAQSPADACLTHQDLSESNPLSTKFDACFTLGNRDLHGRFLLRCTKTPRSCKPDPYVVRFEETGVREIVEVCGAGVLSSKKNSWIAPPIVNIDEQTMAEVNQLAAELEQEQSDARAADRFMLVRAED